VETRNPDSHVFQSNSNFKKITTFYSHLTILTLYLKDLNIFLFVLLF